MAMELHETQVILNHFNKQDCSFASAAELIQQGRSNSDSKSVTRTRLPGQFMCRCVPLIG